MRRICVVAVILALVASSATQGEPASGARWKQFQPVAELGGIGGISMGAGEGLWFSGYTSFLRFASGRRPQVFTPGPHQPGPGGLGLSSDGRLYSAVCCDYSGTAGVLIVSSRGAIAWHKFPTIGESDGDIPNDGIVLGPDGNMWFSLYQHYGFITPAGTFTEFPIHLPGGLLYNSAAPGIARDGSGHIWIPVFKNNGSPYSGYMARIDVARGAREDLMTTPCQYVGAPVEGSDGKVYLACVHIVNSRQVVDLMLIRPNGGMRIISDPYQISFPNYSLNSSSYMTAAPGKIWFVTASPAGELGVYDIATRRFQAYAPPPSIGPLQLIGADRAGNIGFESNQYAIGEFFPS